MASIHITFNASRVFLGVLHWVSEWLAEEGEQPWSSCCWWRVRAQLGPASVCDTVSWWQDVLSQRCNFSFQIISHLMEVYHFGLETELAAWESTFSHNNYYGSSECSNQRQIEGEVISPWPSRSISYIYWRVCAVLSTQSCTLWLNCYNTSLPAEREVFLPLHIPPTAQSPALPSAHCYLWDRSGSWGSLVAWQHRARRQRRRGKLGHGRGCHPLWVVLRSAHAKAIRHVASPRVSLFPSCSG